MITKVFWVKGNIFFPRNILIIASFQQRVTIYPTFQNALIISLNNEINPKLVKFNNKSKRHLPIYQWIFSKNYTLNRVPTPEKANARVTSL